MARQFELKPSKTYANENNLRKAIATIPDFTNGSLVRYIIVYNKDGRCFPVFIGPSAIQLGLHQSHIVVG